jgi:hypothetical protein
MKSNKHAMLHSLCKRGAKLKQTGDFKGALELFNKALTIDPYCVGAYQGKVNLPGIELSDKEIQFMEKILSLDNQGPSTILILYALARVYDQKGQYRKSFVHLQKANDLKRRTLNYNPNVIKNDVVTLLELFTELETIKSEIPKDTGKTPIFIIGMPRSGTTLVEQIISSHPDVYAGGEMLAFSKASELLYPHTNMLAPRGKRLLGVTHKVKEAAKACYFQGLPKTNKNITHITDKMPYNFLNIAWIHMLFSNPILIHVKRNKMANLFSCYQQNFAKGSEWSYDIGELHIFYDSIDLLTQYWKVLFPGTIYNVEYESIVENQEEETRKLIDYCGLLWNDSCLAFEKNKRKVLTASVCQVRQPIYKGSLEHWKNYATYLNL